MCDCWVCLSVFFAGWSSVSECALLCWCFPFSHFDIVFCLFLSLLSVLFPIVGFCGVRRTSGHRLDSRPGLQLAASWLRPASKRV